MSITAEEKTRLMKEFATKEGDTGSAEVPSTFCIRTTSSSLVKKSTDM